MSKSIFHKRKQISRKFYDNSNKTIFSQNEVKQRSTAYFHLEIILGQFSHFFCAFFYSIFGKMTYFVICHFDKNHSSQFWKILSSDYRVIIRGHSTNQRPEFSVITFVIILKSIKNTCITSQFQLQWSYTNAKVYTRALAKDWKYHNF